MHLVYSLSPQQLFAPASTELHAPMQAPRPSPTPGSIQTLAQLPPLQGS
jgi:hypothetical protein